MKEVNFFTQQIFLVKQSVRKPLRLSLTDWDERYQRVAPVEFCGRLAAISLVHLCNYMIGQLCKCNKWLLEDQGCTFYVAGQRQVLTPPLAANLMLNRLLAWTLSHYFFLKVWSPEPPVFRSRNEAQYIDC